MRANRLLPLAELVGVTHDSPLYNENSRRSVLYAQSWALTHMLVLGEPGRAPHLGEYLSKVDQGVPASNAWNQVFANDPVERDLKRYVGQNAFRATQYKFSEKLATFDATATPLTAVDGEAFLADILLQQGRTAEAAARLAKVSADRPWPVTVTALLQAANRDSAGAEKTLLGLAAPADWLTAYRAEVGLIDLLDGRDLSAEHLSAARRLFEASRTAGRETPNAIARLIALELSSADSSVTPSRTAIERARMMAPGRDDYVFLHARVLAREKSYAGARTLVGPMMSPIRPPRIREYARSLMGYIGELERVDAARAAGASAVAAPTALGDPPRDGNRQPAPGEVQAVFRKTQPDEQRIEGVLERIECASNSVTFHVRGTGAAVRLKSSNLTSVDFISYRDDLGGSVSCGALKEPARVYMTSRAGATEAERVVVAVEFLPK